jgi:hypothetical protein
MEYRKTDDKSESRNAERSSGRSRCGPWVRNCAAAVVVGSVLLSAQQTQQNGQQSSSSQPAGETGPDRAWTTSPQIALPIAQTGQQSFDAANTERRKQIADDSQRLLKLATDLKTEVDKTTKDTLSLSVIRKADEIEKLAHNVKEKMKLTTGTN